MAIVSDVCHDADIVNDTNHHKHIATAAAELQCSRQHIDLICSNGNDSNNSCDGSRSSGSSRACPPSFPNTVPPLPHVCDGYSDSATAVQGHPSVADSLDGIPIILMVVFFTPSQSSTTAAEAATRAAPPASTATPPVSLSAYAALADRQLGTDEIHMLGCRLWHRGLGGLLNPSALQGSDDDARNHSRYFTFHPAPYNGTVNVADSSTQSSTEDRQRYLGHQLRKLCNIEAEHACVADREADVVEVLLMKLLQAARVNDNDDDDDDNNDDDDNGLESSLHQRRCLFVLQPTREEDRMAFSATSGEVVVVHDRSDGVEEEEEVVVIGGAAFEEGFNGGDVIDVDGDSCDDTGEPQQPHWPQQHHQQQQQQQQQQLLQQQQQQLLQQQQQQQQQLHQATLATAVAVAATSAPYRRSA
ncbi:hypothetical protein PTSG_02992 [Salpingoeca rosetta]|uniref:Uncharacterized protein n=1 Tax=Salpingoeca rosetta (strain ATCC 50818 / BSB-021) TaxID=946362 RepID=F2U3Y4_SALR5|nr:uncharacterized protein PTSG_02992 [Salpingoeca rosetta]EGD82328.1 hypothetical protein PTSG_02992 [Salpingoeca rosetta]|eukprot:XP_004996511.1 hypothetical protein PTSG_02992 [Salpingoeca rosetta]